jgi:hypothetical protein
MDVLNTKLRQLQYRGPSSSDDYNARVEENYTDLVLMRNRLGLLTEDVREGYMRAIKDQIGIAEVLDALEERLTVLEASDNVVPFASNAQEDCDRFNTSVFAISSVNRLFQDRKYGYILLPKIDTSSLSKLMAVDPDGRPALPSSLETRVSPVAGSVDDGSNYVDTSEPDNAFFNRPGRVWERNVVASATNNTDYAQLDFYVKLPTDLFTTANANALFLDPFPLYSFDILKIEYTTTADVLMENSDGYIPLNNGALFSGDPNAIGWVPPGGWVGDEILTAGAKAFHFDPKPITGFRIRLRQRRYYAEANKFIYTYGLSGMDVRYDKYLSTGKTIIRFEAPQGDTISSVSNVQPEIYNVSQSNIPKVFSHRVIWETSYESGVYTLNPVPNSTRVWVEVTLNQSPGKGSPALMGLAVSYS